MEEKKYSYADVTKSNGLFINIGLSIALLIVLMAFEWKSYSDSSQIDLGPGQEMFVEVLDVPQTEQVKPEKPKIQSPEIIEVPDNEQVIEDINIDFNIDVTEEMVVPDFVESNEDDFIVEELFKLESQPEPEGGMATFYEYVAKNLQYPVKARRVGIEGKVFVKFVVDRDGSLTNVEVIRGIGYGCDEAAKEVLNNAPKWSPGKQRGRPVRARMVLPITFKLAN